jgi:erythromycin esterase
MRLRIVTVLCLWCCLKAKAQLAIKDFVQEQAISIHTVSPDSTDYADLIPLGQAIGNSRIVMLGEQDHGDAPTMAAKSRMVSFLHEHLGFDVLIFESDFFALQGSETLSDKALATRLQENIYNMWTGCRACSGLFEHYIPDESTGPDPLYVAGMDDQMDFPVSVRSLSRTLDSLLRKAGFGMVKYPNYISSFLPLVDSLTKPRWYVNASDTGLTKLGKYLESIRSEASKYWSEKDYGYLLIENLIMEARAYQALKSKDGSQALKLREQQMAKNLKWLVTYKYPGKKIIVWAANNSVARFPQGPYLPDDNRVATMGKLFTQDTLLDKETYVLGFTSFSGEGGRLGLKKYSIEPPAAESFESWVQPSMSYAFVNFKGFTGSQDKVQPKFEMRFWYYKSFKEVWNEVFDGMFFVRQTYPCTN